MSAYSKQDSREVVGRFSQSDAFWQSFSTTVPRSPRAFLGMYLKEAVRLMRAGVLSLHHECLETYASRSDVSEIDVRKILTALLPECRRWEDADYLMQLFGGDDHERRAAYLLRVDTLPCRFVLFREMQKCEGQLSLHVKVCQELIKRGRTADFNLAALLGNYFDLPNVGATFGLRLQPYELSRFDGSYANFKSLIQQF
ncbi:MAG: hypothetical protein IJ786_04105 [Bacteroidaceae bacterium]|nr:hypothetical protein [Bacteroidaceae bacterium]